MSGHSPLRTLKASPGVIRLAVMLYFRLPLSLRNVEDLRHERGIELAMSGLSETSSHWSDSTAISTAIVALDRAGRISFAN